jgi:hypothetical protein
MIGHTGYGPVEKLRFDGGELITAASAEERKRSRSGGGGW